MCKTVTRMLAIMLAICTLVSVAVIPGSAETYITYRTGANAAHANYKSSRFYSNLMRVPLTGDGRTDVVAAAMSQVGYEEGNSLSGLGGTSGGSSNYTEYCYNMGDWGSGYGGSSYAWCATFVSWALYQSRCTNQMGYSDWCRNHTGSSSYIWCEVSCSQWANQLRRYGYFKYSAQNGGTYKPQPGDLIFFDWAGGSSGEDHIGIVVYSDSSKVYTIEGNTSDAAGLEDNGGGAYFKSYSLSYGYITGYGVLPYKTNSSVPDIDYSCANPTPGLYMAAGGTRSVYSTETGTSASYTMPRFTMFEVLSVCSNGRLKVTYTNSSGTKITGYIVKAANNTVQISTTQVDGLSDAIAAAEAIYHRDYSEEVLTLIRAKYATAKSLSASTSATYTQKKTCADELNALIARKGQGTLVTGGIAVNKYNAKITTADCNIFTPSFGTVTASTANHKWTTNVLATWNTTKEAYVIDSIDVCPGADVTDIALAGDQILIAIHQEAGYTISINNGIVINGAKKGDILTFYGTNPKSPSASVGMYFTIEAGYIPGDLSGDDIVSVADCLIAENYIAGKALAEDVMLRGDLNEDSILSVTDVLIMESIIEGKS